MKGIHVASGGPAGKVGFSPVNDSGPRLVKGMALVDFIGEPMKGVTLPQVLVAILEDAGAFAVGAVLAMDTTRRSQRPNRASMARDTDIVAR
jgi:hypothetical protein